MLNLGETRLSLEKLKKDIYWYYFQYTLLTTTYVMEPFEARIFNATVLAILVLACYSTVIYLPLQINRIFQQVFLGNHVAILSET